ncbi:MULTISPECIES: mannitol-1-phosphate 5-dehydrogenase [unclassified Paenibacillus]|uniref:mannitol-1-phosphate 5-dehydrogenase n=1 Tax=unclassified Paenibacillus TaxID=185978 RepID=UPI0024062B66|nr:MULTISPECIES: mannitol-1-phosphate 5-dehydrogenase [unclassified Paenibacillus]MDF9841610.1 mannitol-1-phosphate 5-dehydrogenase [Paenibacillus sp. PastF-2]MDF9848278.1 mannitol-1-phosphate 5-dehydrogenase [Paenibacillus sp. PastM-2]MDF9854769.1 mannitol-1-phosphate 5-dehydrogenase [Paenibacillus sp. PastF-1]MDH6480039.1 mannitol-1-phosphate 5-dehydrogenase [Paenibacillus sp. PastH-2]MDH6507472.1 mannitol-1-phosphate 5-dehydrogenase [Paenibacillus sp. PastM-3]
MKAVHFGAGNIGRGFIGLLLSQAGYEVCFVDVNEAFVSQLKERGEYPVTLASEGQETVIVKKVTALSSVTHAEEVAAAIAEADLVTTAVGVSILKHIAGVVADGIKRRIAVSDKPLHVIACENAIGGSAQLKELVYAQLDDTARAKADASVAFPNAAVDRIVPLQQHEDILKVVVEPFYEWVVDASQMLPGYTPVEGVHYVENLEPYIERKLFTVNTGHCSAAYLGFLRGYETIQQAMADENLTALVREVLEETGAVLVQKHGFDSAEHSKYIDKILERFRNPALTDEVSRVGRSPIRKLSPNDRLVSPALQAYDRGLSYKALTRSMAGALLFQAADDPEAVELQAAITELGVEAALTKYTGLAADHAVHQSVMAEYAALK